MCAKFHFVINLFRAIMTVDLTIWSGSYGIGWGIWIGEVENEGCGWLGYGRDGWGVGDMDRWVIDRVWRIWMEWGKRMLWGIWVSGVELWTGVGILIRMGYNEREWTWLIFDIAQKADANAGIGLEMGVYHTLKKEDLPTYLIISFNRHLQC